MDRMPGPRVQAAVVIVTKNDPRLDACLASVFAQTPPFPFDVVVVDNDSAPAFRERAAERWGARPRFRLLHVGGNFSAAWNQGAQESGAEVIARLDSDTIAHTGWLERLLRPLEERPDLAWTAGPVVGPEPLRSLTQRYFHYRTLGYQRRLEGDVLPTDAVPSWNVAYRGSALTAVGGYDPWQRSSIDWDLHKRLSMRGFRGVFVPGAVLTHDHPARLRDFYRKEAWYRTGQYQMMLKYGSGAMLGAALLPGVYVALAGLALLGVFDSRFADLALILAALLVVKQWLGAKLERDRVWWARPFYRLVEGVAGLHGLLRGLFRYGVARRPIPEGAGRP